MTDFMPTDLEDIVSTDGIINWLKEKVEKHVPIPPGVWLDAAQKLNVLLGDEHKLLFQLQQIVAKYKLQLLNSQESINVSEAKMRVEATDEYRMNLILNQY